MERARCPSQLINDAVAFGRSLLNQGNGFQDRVGRPGPDEHLRVGVGRRDVALAGLAD